MADALPELIVGDVAAWRTWLGTNHARHSGVWLVLALLGLILWEIGGKATAGVMKDVVMLGGFQDLDLDFVADNPGLTLFHCHQQVHMDFGFMALFKYA